MAGEPREERYPKQSWSTTAAGWLVLSLTAVYGVVNAVSLVGAAIAETDMPEDAVLGQGEATAIAVVTAIVVLLPIHLWTFFLGRRLLRRRGAARWPALVTFGIFTMSLLVAVSTDNASPLQWGTLIANTAIIVLLSLPSTRRDLWWADMARTRPDYVAERLGNTTT